MDACCTRAALFATRFKDNKNVIHQKTVTGFSNLNEMHSGNDVTNEIHFAALTRFAYRANKNLNSKL